MSETLTCCKCKQLKANSQFQLYKGKPNGWCRACKTASEKARRVRVGVKPRKLSKLCGDTKLCLSCEIYKKLSEFSPTIRGLAGVSSYCRNCVQKRPKDNEKARAATKKYRKENAEVYKANHRLHQYKRRTKMEASSDGTLTQAFLETLYRTLFCSYCFKYTVESDRTLDHVVPLSKGGLHSASNAVMACRSCNCSKRDKLVNVK